MRRRWARVRSLDARQWWVVVCSAVLVPLVQLSLRARGLGCTARTLGRWSAGLADPADVAAVELARHLAEPVALVAGRKVIGSLCLGRSLVLWFLLRRRGIDAELVIGAQAPVDGHLPAHAWVEVQGIPVNDEPDVRTRFGSFGLSLPRLTAP